MFAARGVALGLGGGGVNLKDFRHLTQQSSRPNGSNPTVRKNVSNCAPSSVTDVDRRQTTNFDRQQPSSTSISMGSVKKRKKPKKTRIVVKKSLDRSTFWSVCRATIFGILLMALGAAMSTLGYYKDHFATETTHDGNTTVQFINPSYKRQFESLSYVGPCIMGIGAFVLMIACVMTMEGREKNLNELRPRTETTNSRVALATAIEDNRIEPTILDGPPKYTDADPDANNNRGDVNLISPADQENLGGKSNECCARDDSKSASTTTTTLTLSKNVGLKCEPANQLLDEEHCSNAKYPSASCIDVLVSKTQDARALLQRFLEDESRLVERRMDKFRKKKRFKSSYLTNQSVSLDISDSEKTTFMQRNVKSDEIPSKRNIVADVHHCGLDCESSDAVMGFTSVTLDSPYSGSGQWPNKSSAPTTHDDCYSPMSLLSYEQSTNMDVVNENFSNDYCTSPKRMMKLKVRTNNESLAENSFVGPLDNLGNGLNGNNRLETNFLDNGQLYGKCQKEGIQIV